jgi:hypothetical protein
MISQPIIIDGPARGKKMVVQGHQFVVSKTPRINVQDYFCDPDMMAATVPYFEQVLYHVHTYKIGTLEFAIASVKCTRPPVEKVMKRIFTRSAIEAIVR